jgi:hypothetical protein
MQKRFRKSPFNILFETISSFVIEIGRQFNRIRIKYIFGRKVEMFLTHLDAQALKVREGRGSGGPLRFLSNSSDGITCEKM